MAPPHLLALLPVNVQLSRVSVARLYIAGPELPVNVQLVNVIVSSLVMPPEMRVVVVDVLSEIVQLVSMIVLRALIPQVPAGPVAVLPVSVQLVSVRVAP